MNLRSGSLLFKLIFQHGMYDIYFFQPQRLSELTKDDILKRMIN
jgi:hypothetical protein